MISIYDRWDQYILLDYINGYRCLACGHYHYEGGKLYATHQRFHDAKGVRYLPNAMILAKKKTPSPAREKISV